MMQYIKRYESPLGPITLVSSEEALTGLWFGTPEDCGEVLPKEWKEADVPVLQETEEWLNLYFGGEEPDFMPRIQLQGTPFRMAVWKILQTIPYGETMTYGEIARRIAEQKEIKRMSAQAVGGAVGSNPVSILVPCHRVVGMGGNLTGYGGGMDKKVFLLTLEGLDRNHFKIPKSKES